MRVVLLIAVAVCLVSSTDAQTRYEWVGGASGDWTEASNWSPNGVPAATDTAVVGAEGQSIRTAVLTANTTVARLEMIAFGGIAGDFDLMITDHLQWEGGGGGVETFQGSGTVTIASGATAHFADGTPRYQMSTGRLLVNDGSILWDGTGTWQGGRLVNNGEVELAMEGDVSITFSSLADAITNSTGGLIRRTGTGAVTTSSGVVNDGLIRVESGVLDLGSFNSSGVTGTGSIEVQSGAELRVGGRGNNTQASITGDAVTLTAFGGRQVVTDTYDVTTTHIMGTAGRLVLNTDATTDNLVMENGFLDGSGALTVTSSMTWTGGTMEGTGTTSLGPAIPLTIGGDATIRLSGSRTLRTEGPVTWTGDADIGSGTSTTTFENAGTLTSSGAGERLTSFVTFRNTGTVAHDGGTLRFGGPMSNEGTVRVEAGAFRLGSNGTDTGRYEVAEDGRLEFIFGNRTFAESAEVTGTGTVAFTGGTVTNRATWQPGASPGTLTIESDWDALEPEGALEVEVGGSTPGTEFDQLEVTGAFEAGGTLRVTLTDGFTPQDGDRFLIIPASEGARGSFDTVEIPTTSPEGYVQMTSAGVIYGLGTPVSNEEAEPGESLPTELALHPPAPNPTRAASSMQVDLPEAARVRLAAYDALGREVAVALDEDRPAGRHTVALAVDGLAPGVYVVRLVAGDEVRAQRLTVVW